MKHPLRIAAAVCALCAAVALRAGAQETDEEWRAAGEEKQGNGDLAGAIADYDKAIALNPKYDAAYVDRGYTKQDNGDYDGAVADFNRAIEINPKNADAYDDRGMVKLYFKGDSGGTIADCTRAIELDPANLDALNNRGNAKVYTGDLDGAIADFAAALKIDRKSTLTYVSLATARIARGDMTGAMEDINRAVQLEPYNAIPIGYRGFAEFEQGQLKEAIADFHKSLDLPGTDGADNTQDYARIWLWMARVQLGQADAATKDFSQLLDIREQQQPGLWTSKIGDFFMDRISEADFIKAADGKYKVPDPDMVCEAWFYSGMKKLFAGDKKTAAEDFRKAVATARRGSGEYQMAGIELKTLGQQDPVSKSEAN